MHRVADPSYHNMVRFKNRYLIVELLRPSESAPQLFSQPPEFSSTRAGLEKTEITGDDDEDDNDDDEDVALARIPDLPFLLPPIPDVSSLKDSDEGGKSFYRAVRDNVQDVFGDEGWGRVSSSFRGESVYNSQAARSHLK